MTHSNNSRTISLVCELRMFRVLCMRSSLPQWGSVGSQSELTLIQASASWSSQQQTRCCDKLLPFLWTVNDVTLAIDIQMTWWREVHLNAPMKSQFKQVNTPVADSLKIIEMFLLVQVNGRQTRWHRQNITVVENMFVVMIINSDPVYVVSSITKLLLVIQISYLANLV